MSAASPDDVKRIGAGELRAFISDAGELQKGTVLFDGNYMYLRRPPRGDSLLDLMGPWPWYIASVAALALALFWLLDRPFDGRRRAAGS